MARGFEGAARHVEIGDVWIDVSIREQHGLSAEVTEHPVELGASISDHIRPQAPTFVIEGLVTNHPIELPLSHTGGARVDAASVPIETAASPLPRVAPSSIQIEGEPSVGLIGVLPGVDQGVAILGALKVDVRSKRRFAAEQYNVNPNARTTYASTALHFTQSFDRVGAVHAALTNIITSRRLVTVVTGLVIYRSVALTDLTVERGKGIGTDTLKFTVVGRVIRIVRSETVELPKPLEPRSKAGQSKGKQSTTAVAPSSLSPSAQDQTSAALKLKNAVVESLGLGAS